MDLYLLLFFLAGVLQDFIATLNIRFIDKGKVFFAAFTSFVTTLITFTVLFNILTRLDSEGSLLAIIVYSLGIGTGTILAMKFRIKKKIKIRSARPAGGAR